MHNSTNKSANAFMNKAIIVIIQHRTKALPPTQHAHGKFHARTRIINGLAFLSPTNT